jgi:hypothetical protein
MVVEMALAQVGGCLGPLGDDLAAHHCLAVPRGGFVLSSSVSLVRYRKGRAYDGDPDALGIDFGGRVLEVRGQA